MSDCKYSSATRSTGSIGRGFSRGQSTRAAKPASTTTASPASPTNQRRRDDRACDSLEATKTEADGVLASADGACGWGVSTGGGRLRKPMPGTALRAFHGRTGLINGGEKGRAATGAANAQAHERSRVEDD